MCPNFQPEGSTLTSCALAAAFVVLVAGGVEGIALGSEAVSALLAAAGRIREDAGLLSSRAVLDVCALRRMEG